jgi:hypothetical protein
LAQYSYSCFFLVIMNCWSRWCLWLQYFEASIHLHQLCCITSSIVELSLQMRHTITVVTKWTHSATFVLGCGSIPLGCYSSLHSPIAWLIFQSYFEMVLVAAWVFTISVPFLFDCLTIGGLLFVVRIHYSYEIVNSTG